MKNDLVLRIIGWILIPYVMIGIMVSKETNSKSNGIIAGFVSGIIIFSIYCCLGIGGTITDSVTDTDTNKISELESKIETLESQLNNKEKEIKSLQNKQSDDKATTKPTPKDTPKPTEKPKPKEYTFGSGNFTSGTDFEPGTYDIIAVSGSSGNVSSDNIFSGGINAVMGLDKEFAEQEYKNIELPSGTKLTISGGIKIKLVKK